MNLTVRDVFEAGGMPLLAGLAAASGPTGRTADRASNSQYHKLLIFFERFVAADDDDRVEDLEETLAEALRTTLGEPLKLIGSGIFKSGHLLDYAVWARKYGKPDSMSAAIANKFDVMLLEFPMLAKVLAGADDKPGNAKRLLRQWCDTPELSYASLAAVDERLKPYAPKFTGQGAAYNSVSTITEVIALDSHTASLIGSLSGGGHSGDGSGGGGGGGGASLEVSRKAAAENAAFFEDLEYKKLLEEALEARALGSAVVNTWAASKNHQFLVKAKVTRKPFKFDEVGNIVVAAQADCADFFEKVVMEGSFSGRTAVGSDDEESEDEDGDGGIAGFGIEPITLSTKTVAALASLAVGDVDFNYITFEVFCATTYKAADKYTAKVDWFELPDPTARLPVIESLLNAAGVPSAVVDKLLGALEHVCRITLASVERNAMLAKILSTGLAEIDRQCKAAAGNQRSLDRVTIGTPKALSVYSDYVKGVQDQHRQDQSKRATGSNAPAKAPRRADTSSSTSPPKKKMASVSASVSVEGASAAKPGKANKPGSKLHCVSFGKTKDVFAISDFVYDWKKLRKNAVASGMNVAAVKALETVAPAFMLNDGAASMAQRRLYVPASRKGENLRNPFTGFNALDYLLKGKTKTDFPLDF